MQSITSHAAPNVVPGTSFNTKRFQELYAWVTAAANDAARSVMVPYQFGLLLPFDGKQALQLEKSGDKLTLCRCAGITPAGQVIGVFEGLTPVLETGLERYQLDEEEQYYVLLESNGKHRVAFGQQSEDLPARPRFSMPQYHLHLQPTGQPVGCQPNAFPIGILVFDRGEWELAQYIPPCAQIGAHPILKTKYGEYQSAMKTMLAALPNIVRQTDSFRSKAMIELREFAMQCGSFLAARQPGMNALTAAGRPFDLLETWMAFANLTSFLLNCLTDRPGFYNLLYENTRSVNGVMFTTERLDSTTHKLTHFTYDHLNVAAAVEAIDSFLEIMVPVFKALGNGTLQPRGSGYEETYKAAAEESKSSYSTW